MKIFFANFCQRREHIVSLNSVTFFRLVIPQDYVDLYRGSHSPCASADCEKYDGFWRQIMLASLTKVREKYFHFFLFVRNVINDIHVHSFDP